MEELHLLKENVKQGNDQSKLDPKKVYSVFHWTSNQENMYISIKKVPYTNTFVCVLDLVQPSKLFTKIIIKSQAPSFPKCI